MSEYRVKILKDKNNESFLPFTTTKAVFIADEDTTDTLQDVLDNKQDTLIPGPGITIDENNVISSTSSSVSWGNITGNIDSQTDLKNKLDAKQDELTAGENITIEDNVISATVAEAKPYLSLERLGDYIYKISFDTLPEEPDNVPMPITACSSYVKDGKLYRNLDWNYADTAEFIVETKNFKGMSFVNGLNDSNLDDEKIKALPYRIVDGINKYGIMISTHVLFNDWEFTGSGEENVPIYNIPYLVLQNITSLDNFATTMATYLDNITVPASVIASGYLLQFLVTDGTTTYVILPPESSDGTYSVVDATDNPKLTNFRWVDREEVERSDEDIQDRPTGIERFNAMPCALADIKFTNAYETPDYLSEFIGINDTTKDSTDEELTAIYNLARQEYLTRERDGATWQTMHSVVYSVKGMTSLYVQEDYNRNYVSGGSNMVVRIDGTTLIIEEG